MYKTVWFLLGLACCWVGSGWGCSRVIPPDQKRDAAVDQAELATEEKTETTEAPTTTDAGHPEVVDEVPEPVVEREPADIPPVPKYPVHGYLATVVHVTDGDTVYLVMQPGGWASRVRLKGVNAPECQKINSPGTAFQHCSADKDYFGLSAYEILNQLMTGSQRKVKISCTMKGEFCEVDEFDRYLAYLAMPDGRDVGETVIASGACWSFTRYSNDKIAEYCRAEAQAIRNKKGMWQQGRAAVKQKMSSSVSSWYYKETPNHDKACSDALQESFAKLAGE